MDLGGTQTKVTRNHTMPRIAVLAPSGGLDHQPSVLNAITCFRDSGCSVDVFSIRNSYFNEPQIEGVTFRYLPVRFHSSREPRTLVSLLFAAWALMNVGKKYDALFAGGIRALFAAWFVTRFRPNRVINLQLELYIGEKLDTHLGSLFKWLERRAVCTSWANIVQDQTRADMFSNDVGIELSRIDIVPNAPLGPALRLDSDLLRQRFSIPRTRRLLLSPGTFGPLFQTRELAEASRHLPPDLVCVLHSASGARDDDEFVKELHSVNPGDSLLLSLEPVPYEQIDELMASADIGVALYGAAGGMNTTEVGLASGKLCQFLKVGKPVIVSNYKVLREFVEKYKCGIAIDGADQVAQAATTIIADYEEYSNGAIRAFDDELAFEKHFSVIVKRLHAEVSSHN